MIKKGTILICNREISDTTIGKEYLVIKDDTIEDDNGCERYMKYHVEEGSFSVKSLKIGDTFEYNGFVCEVLHQIDEKKWFILKSPNNKDISYEKLDSEGLKDINHLYTKQEITDKEFINQLEENAK